MSDRTYCKYELLVWTKVHDFFQYVFYIIDCQKFTIKLLRVSLQTVGHNDVLFKMSVAPAGTKGDNDLIARMEELGSFDA